MEVIKLSDSQHELSRPFPQLGSGAIWQDDYWTQIHKAVK